MIGTNTLRLNQATLCAAVEEYLNRRALSSAAVKVTQVVADVAGNVGTTFNVEVEATNGTAEG